MKKQLILKGYSDKLAPGKTVVVFHAAPPFKTFLEGQEVEGSIAIFESGGFNNEVQFWMHEDRAEFSSESVRCTLCTVDAEYEIIGEL